MIGIYGFLLIGCSVTTRPPEVSALVWALTGLAGAQAAEVTVAARRLKVALRDWKKPIYSLLIRSSSRTLSGLDKHKNASEGSCPQFPADSSRFDTHPRAVRMKVPAADRLLGQAIDCHHRQQRTLTLSKTLSRQPRWGTHLSESRHARIQSALLAHRKRGTL
jgi:hypothetical protein